MGFKKPGARLFQNIPIPRVKKGLTGHGSNRSVDASLNLTAMVDIFTILVCFLLMMFSASGEIITGDPDIKMPGATNNKDLKRAVLVQVSTSTLKLEGSFVMPTALLLDERAADEAVIAPLTQKLIERRKILTREARGKPPPDDVIIQADVNVDYLAMKRIMKACVQNGFGHVNLAVEAKVKGK